MSDDKEMREDFEYAALGLIFTKLTLNASQDWRYANRETHLAWQFWQAATASKQVEIDALRAALEASEKRVAELEAPRWISVDNKLPEVGTLTLCRISLKSRPHDAQTMVVRYFDNIESTLVTHWMPLPAPPKENG